MSEIYKLIYIYIVGTYLKGEVEKQSMMLNIMHIKAYVYNNL